jgi:hypothetical protein
MFHLVTSLYLINGTTVFFLNLHLLLLKIFERGTKMKQKNEFPSREELDEAFHYLHDRINWISVVEEVEMQKKENEEHEE